MTLYNLTHIICTLPLCIPDFDVIMRGKVSQKQIIPVDGEGVGRRWRERMRRERSLFHRNYNTLPRIHLGNNAYISLSLKTIKVITGPHNTIEVNENLLYIRSNPSNLTLPNKEQIQTFKANNTFLIHKTNIQETMDHVYPSYL